ncbi:M16 family metallopeptidase [Algoriphagus hitonicola]|uniref:Predicted Zn-dependent peptidase n=1 Tax=Algoriphagus hitonicola TaxID=435880 RepID=A0A1I2XMR8_9BACT|nr:pitrilysin family protein [Algoriphagus hitonicola]SFH14397.1 Predicted Zn-dependent peptidase [Algoriphagus hitonicola]
MKKIINTIVFGLLVVTSGFAQVDRSKLPASGPAPEIKIGDAETFTLDNGLKIFVVNNDKLPRVSFSLVLDRDPLFEGDKAGLTGFVGQMLTSGTTNRTKDQLDEEIDFIGASLSASSTSIFASSLKKHQKKVLELMADVLYNPSFPEEEMEKIRKQTLTGLATSKDNPDAIASRLAAAMVYGKDHPYGEVSTEETIKNISVDDVRNYYQTFFKPNIAYLVVVGDMTKAEAEQVVGDYFSRWEQGDVPSFDYPTPSRTNTTKVGLVDRSSSVQTVINVSQPVELKLGDKDYIPSRLLNQILGGGSSSRLFVNLREDKGYTYGAYSSIGSDRLIARFSANASVRTEVTDSAMVEMLYEINKIVDEGVTEEELEKAKANLSGSFGRSLESPQTIANFALNIERYDLPKDFYANYLKNLNDLSVEDINATAKRLIDPDKLYVMAVGNGDAIKDKLEQFGPITMYDNLGFEAKELTADADMTAEKVIENYLEAIGGAESARNIKTAKVTLVAEVMGNSLTIDAVYDVAGKYGQKTSVMGNVMQSTTLIGDEGTVSMQGQTMEIPEDQFDMAKINSYLFPEAIYQDLGYTLRLDGLKDVEGTPAYKVAIVTDSGTELVNYYDQETGLKIKNENPVAGDTFYSDYQPKAGVLIPMMWTIKSAMIPVPMEAKVSNLEINPELTEEDFK